VTAFLIKLTD